LIKVNLYYQAQMEQIVPLW